MSDDLWWWKGFNVLSLKTMECGVSICSWYSYLLVGCSRSVFLITLVSQFQLRDMMCEDNQRSMTNPTSIVSAGQSYYTQPSIHLHSATSSTIDVSYTSSVPKTTGK